MSYQLGYTTVPATLNTSYSSLGCILYGGNTPTAPFTISPTNQFITTNSTGYLFTNVSVGNYLFTFNGTGTINGSVNSSSTIQVALNYVGSSIIYSQYFYPNSFGKVSIDFTVPIPFTSTQNLRCYIQYSDANSTNSITLSPSENNTLLSNSYWCTLTRIG